MNKTIIALARLYKGVLIFRTTENFVIFNAIGDRLLFSCELDALDYVDDWSLAGTYSPN